MNAPFKEGDKVFVEGVVDCVEEEEGKYWVRVKLPGQGYLEFDADVLEIAEEA
jgi:hypothetical protein